MQHAYELVCYSVFAVGVFGWMVFGAYLIVKGE